MSEPVTGRPATVEHAAALLRRPGGYRLGISVCGRGMGVSVLMIVGVWPKLADRFLLPPCVAGDTVRGTARRPAIEPSLKRQPRFGIALASTEEWPGVGVSPPFGTQGSG